MAIKPILHRILVKPHDVHEKDESFAAARRMKLEIVGKELEREQGAVDTGVVVSWGPTVFIAFETDNPLTVGDRVVFAKYGGKTVEDPETKEKFVLLNDEDIIAILN